jgi:hypothetical protein
MAIDVPPPDRIEMSQHERDILKVMEPVLRGERTQAEAARLLGLSVRQVRRLQNKLEAFGAAAVVHGLRGRPSNHCKAPAFRQQVLDAYRAEFPGFGPTLAAEKLAGVGLPVSADTLRRWLIDEGLWQRQRRREPHRSRRPRRACFGELVQMDASIHDWLEGRGETPVLLGMIDDATSRVLVRFYPEATVQTHMDLLWRWIDAYGRPLALYTDRHSIFEPQDKGRALPDAETQFGRALRELDVELIRARSPQAKGRVERLFGTAQDRWVKELRLAGACTIAAANTVLERLLPEHNGRFVVEAQDGADAHRALGAAMDLAAILSIQERRVVANDYTIRFRNRHYQLLPPIYPGERGGKVIVELRLDGAMKVRLGEHYLGYQELPPRPGPGGSAPRPPKFNASTADASAAPTEKDRGPVAEPRPSGVQPAGGRSGRTSAEPYPPDGDTEDTGKAKGRPAEDHPWRKPFKPKK